MVLLFLISLIGYTAASDASQSVSLSGTVSNKNGKPIAGAIVTLANKELKDTTDTNGAYSITSANIVMNPTPIQPRVERITMRNGVISISLPTAAPVRIEMFNLRGNLLERVFERPAAAGDYKFDLMPHHCAANIMVIRAAFGQSTLTFRYLPINKGNRTITSSAFVSSTMGGLAKLQAIVDTLKVSASNYALKDTVISSYDGVVNITLFSLMPAWECMIEGEAPGYIHKIGCKADFTAMASEPMNANIPGALSVKTVIDNQDPSGTGPLYFQNCKEYPIHHAFASALLSGNGKPVVPAMSQFNVTEYTSPARRFVLGEITYFEGPGIWAYEIASLDNATAEMIIMAIEKIQDSCYFGNSLYYHPVSLASEKTAQNLPGTIRVITTDKLYEGIYYQPLNPVTGKGRLVFVKAADLATTYVGFRDIVVLDVIPNDISVTSGIITGAFQTPLAHINVLSQNRGTPNMTLRGAWTDSTLRALEGKWVKLTVGLFDYSITEITVAEADAWWTEQSLIDVSIPGMDTVMREIRDVKDILDIANLGLGGALKKAIPAYGGKTSHFSAFPWMDSTKVPYPKEAFAVPVFYYRQFMEQNGFNAQVAQMLDDPQFKNDPAVRDARLKALRDSMSVAPIDAAFEVALFAKLNAKFASGTQVRFRSSTNAEDLDGFTGAGFSISEGGTMDKPNSIRNAIRTVWGSVWFFQAFEERDYRRIDHKSVGMALLVHRSFPVEEATGVAITANIYDQTGTDPGFYVNVQVPDLSMALPDANATADQFIYKFSMAGQPIVYISHSSLLPEGREAVLTKAQIYKLGVALQEIHEYFKPLYGSDPGKRYAMETEFTFDRPSDDPTEEPVLSIKQCRPYYCY